MALRETRRARRPLRLPKVIGVALCAVVMTSLSGLAANADDWGTGTSDTGAHPDGSSHSFCYQPLNSSAVHNIENAEWNSLEDETDANVVFDSDCDYTGGTETDVSWDTVDLSGSLRGRAYCEDFDNGNCDQFYAELDLDEISEGSNDDIDTTKTACHELGHTVGLTHHSAGHGCMISGEIPGTDVDWRRYVAHHKGHINAWF